MVGGAKEEEISGIPFPLVIIPKSSYRLAKTSYVYDYEILPVL